ncbi:MAG: archaemetzincin family Zn-dependent metalloprotease [Bryobacteraceae bacterium]
MNGIRLVGIGAGSTRAPRNRLTRLAQALSRMMHAEVRIHAGTLDASFARDDLRGQYYSTALLQALQPFAGDSRVLGVTHLDLYVPVLTFVFGEAQLEGNCAVVSMHRLHEEFYGLPRHEELLQERLLKESVHELGHTFGLRHCDNWQCVMASSHAVEVLDIKGVEFCPRCGRAVFGRAGGT